MNYDLLLYEKREYLSKITINRPQAMNALSPQLLKEMNSALELAAKDDQILVVVITGAGRAFSAGVDLLSLEGVKIKNGNVPFELDSAAKALINNIQNIPKVVLAMVNGYCLTGALEIVLACDLIVASEDAKFGDTHTRWGLRPSWGMSQRLPRRIGLLKAKELSFTAEMISGHEAELIGLVNITVPADKLEKTVADLAEKISKNSAGAIAAYKYLYNGGMNGTLESGLRLEDNTKFTIPDTEERLKGIKDKK